MTWLLTIDNVLLWCSGDHSHSLSDPMTLRHHLVTMTIGESLANMNQRTINALITFFVWIVFFHSTSDSAFVLGVQAFWSPKTPSKTILLPNNSPAITTLSFLQLPNDDHAHHKQIPVPNDDSALTILQICIPTTTTSTGLQAYDDH